MKRKFLRGMTALGAAAAMCAACGAVSAFASTSTSTANVFPKSAVTVNGVDDNDVKLTGEITVDVNDDAIAGSKEVLFGIAKKSGSNYVVSAWDVYDVKDAVNNNIAIDLSSLDSSKENYVQIKTEGTEPLTLTFKAVAKPKLKGTLTTDGKIEVKDNGAVILPAKEASATYEYRTQYGSWQDYDNIDDLSKYQDRGAALYFRMKAKEVMITPTNGVCELTNALPGKEAKVSIAKRANGPKATVDYVKGTIKLPKNAQFRIITSSTAVAAAAETGTNNTSPAGLAWKNGDTAAVTWAANLADAKSSKPMPTELLQAGSSLELRTAPTTSKAASRITVVQITAPTRKTLTVADTATFTTGDATYATAGKVSVVSGGSVTVSVKITEVKKKAKFQIEFTGTGGTKDDVFEVIASADDATKLNDATSLTGIKKVKGSGSTKLTYDNGTKLFIRKKGIKADLKKNPVVKGEWPTQFVELGKFSGVAPTGIKAN